MKQGLITLVGLAWIQLAAIVSPALGGGDGIQDCSSLLAVTVTPTARTVTETLTIVPTEYNTAVDAAVFTETVSTTASTETQLVTVGTTVTAATHTDVVTVTTTVVATATDQQTVSVTAPASQMVPVKARRLTETLLDPEPTIPSYAAVDCPSWDKYISACHCASVVPATITAEAPPAATVTVSVTAGAVTIAVPSTVSTTETVFVSVTATTAATEVDTVFITATTAVTESAAVSTTVTITQTVTQTVAPVPSCKPFSEVGAFKAIATETGSPLLMYASLVNGITGGITWQQASSSTAAAIQNKYIWGLDSNGYLTVAYNIPPYTYKYYAYMSTGAPGSNWPQIGTEASVTNSINAGAKMTRIKGCVNSVTGELTLDAAGRTNILYCGQQLWMSAGAGEDINRGTCIKMFPKVSLV
ncbi:hypothetical protein NEMBOFW57_001317 [Staphylotrichum longicolle]|uniref:Uncharacterized protein n=1 Tax=Staphylotrichum longicolle TaxID=669026 RepID=A0AAD4HXS0_9PEZI|nr:hypothetical protein NEMBOFW57_001317 [Staphylotrichum longicolle]